VESISESIMVRLEQAKSLRVLDFDEILQPAETARLRRIFPERGPVQLSFF
jgi:hypothetical protein